MFKPLVRIVCQNNACTKVRTRQKSADTLTYSLDPMHYYTLQCHKTLPSPQRIANQMTETDYSPSEQQILHTGDQYGHTTSLCHRHRQYDTMPKLIDTTSGYCSSSNSSYSNSTNGALPRSRSFQASRKNAKVARGYLFKNFRMYKILFKKNLYK